MMVPVIFREYDIRGVVGKDFDESFAEELGRAYCAYVGKARSTTAPIVTVGHDARESSPSLAQALIRGLVKSGARVFHLGMITTPISYFSTFTVPGVDGGIMITGSHNPPDYNGFKISVGNSTIYGSSIQELRKIIEEKAFVTGQGSETWYDIFPTYLHRYKDEFKTIKKIPVVLDCGNGAAGVVARRMFEQVGLEPTILFEKPDGAFPNHHPDPTVEENLVDLKRAVKESRALLGIGFDGDADRIGVVDDQGRTIFGDELMILFSRAILAVNPGQPIIGDVKCSDRLYADIEKHNGKPIMWKTGHSLIKQKIKEEKAPFGGELSGHIFFADRNFGFDDALYAALRIVEIVANSGKTVSELLKGIPPAYNTPEIRIDTTEEKKVAIVESLKKHFANPPANVRTNLIDGIRVSYPDGWALARASNTQPVLVLRFEAETSAGLKRIQSEFEGIVNRLL